MKLLITLILLSASYSLACTYKTSTTNKYRHEIENEAKNYSITLCVDSKKFYSHELVSMAEAGVKIRLFASDVDYYSHELVNIAEKGRLTVILGTKHYYSHEIVNFIAAGAQVRIRTSQTSYYSHEFVNMAEAGKRRGGLILVVDNQRLYEHEIESIRAAGAQIIRN
jgi:hypothetical protein